MITQTLHAVPTRSALSELEYGIDTRQATVGVVGLGYVGMPLIRAFVNAGFKSLGFDIDDSKVARLQAGESYIAHIEP